MKVVIQRVSQAQVAIEEQIVGQIKQGFMVLVGIHQEDTPEDVAYVVGKIRVSLNLPSMQKLKKAIVPVLLKRLVQMWRFLCMNYLINN